MRIERVLANNPGPFTGPGTNTWVVGDEAGSVAIIDPGPVDGKHAKAILEKVGNRKVEAVLVTHTHPDHAPLANPLARDLGVPAVGYAPGDSFVPAIRLLEGARLDVGDITLQVIHTPGHADDHLCFRVDNALFTGDHIMGGSSVMVEKMGPYLSSLRKLKGTGLERLHPGHGDDMEHPDQVIDWYIAHRMQRHEQIFEAIGNGAGTVPDIVELVYDDVDVSLHPLAATSVTAHVTLLRDEERIALRDDRLVVVPHPT
ncbi:MAG TPA: MBL fold metallo-hydrolase [Acidimicrobiia bacterium]|nr:MBL fold metallo-hydrolase [Acidimicrobiia bacterium]